MKFYGLIAAGAWMNWLGFELDLDHSPDPGTRFTVHFWILTGYLNMLWTNFDEILWVHSCGAARFGYILSWIRIRISLNPESEHVFKIARQIALKLTDGFQWTFVNHWRLHLISWAIRIIFGMWCPYPDFTQIIDYSGFWWNLVQRWHIYYREELSKL